MIKTSDFVKKQENFCIFKKIIEKKLAKLRNSLYLCIRKKNKTITNKKGKMKKWKNLISAATTEEQLGKILALIEHQYNEAKATDEDTRNHCHIWRRRLKHEVEDRRYYLRDHYLQEQERLLAGYIRRQRKDFGWYLDASQKLITLFRQLNDGKGGAE